jgi:hypothetical protein
MSAASESSARNSPVFQEAVPYKPLMIAYFDGFARAAVFAEPVRISLHQSLVRVCTRCRGLDALTAAVLRSPPSMHVMTYLQICPL